MGTAILKEKETEQIKNKEINKETILSVTLYMNGIEQLCVSPSSGSYQGAQTVSSVGEYTSCQRTYRKIVIWNCF